MLCRFCSNPLSETFDEGWRTNFDTRALRCHHCETNEPSLKRVIFFLDLANEVYAERFDLAKENKMIATGKKTDGTSYSSIYGLDDGGGRIQGWQFYFLDETISDLNPSNAAFKLRTILTFQ